MDNLEQVMAQIEKSMAETKRGIEHTESLYLLLKQAVSTPVAEEPIPELVVEPIGNPAQRAFNGLMNQVSRMLHYTNDSLTPVTNQPALVQVELQGLESAHRVMLDVFEQGDGTIIYQLEKRLVSNDEHSGLLRTDEELLALRYLQKELGKGAWKPKTPKDSYRKLLPELKQVCFSGEADATDLATYTDRIDKLNQAGELTDVQLSKLNRLMKELELNWGDQS